MKNVFIETWGNISPTVWNLVVVTTSIGIGLLIKWILHSVFNIYQKRHDHYLAKAVTRHLQAPANILIPLLTLNASLHLLEQINTSSIAKGLELGLIASFAFLLTRLVVLAEDLINHRYDITVSDNLKARKIRTQIRFISRMGIVLIVVLAVAAILLSFDNLRKVGTGLLAGVGVGSVIIGFAAQSTLSNLLAGFQIAFTQPIRIDDVVIVENEWGRIEDITLTYVVVRIWDQRRLVLPINYFIQKPFQNWTRANSELLGTVFLYFDYSVPLDQLRTRFTQLLHGNNLWDGKVSVIQVTECKERTIEVRALMSARNSSDAFDLRCLVREKLIEFVREKFPQSLPKTRVEGIPLVPTP